MPVKNNRTSIREIVINLLTHFSEGIPLKRTFRKQGYSRILALGKLFPDEWNVVYTVKVAENSNAILVLFINPLEDGYVAHFAPISRQHRENA